MIDVDYLLILRALSPEVIVLVAALAAIAAGIVSESKSHGWRALPEAIALLGLAAAGVALVFLVPDVRMLGDMLVLDPLSRLLKLFLLGLSAAIVPLGRSRMDEGNHGEYVAVMLMATIGLMLAVSAEELLLIFLSLELASLSLYILVGFRRSTPASAEAALKYFLFGSVSAAFLLFGISFIYGMTGTTALRQLAGTLAGGEMEPLAVAGMVFVMVGLGFKVAAAPFHPWAPDVYQAASPGTVSLVASSSKLASFLVLLKVVLIGFWSWEGSADWGEFEAGWVPMICALAVASLVVGTFTALAQTSVRRLIAYSAVAHSGYTLVGVAAGTSEAVTAVLFYSLQYAVTAIGLFAVIGWVERTRGGDGFSHFRGVGRRDPVLGISLLIFVASLAGLPPLAGFLGKFYLFATALGAGDGAAGLLWLVVLALAMTVVSIYYYFSLLKESFASLPEESPGESRSGEFCVRMIAVGAAGIVVLLGVWPNLLLAPLRDAVVSWF